MTSVSNNRHSDWFQHTNFFCAFFPPKLNSLKPLSTVFESVNGYRRTDGSVGWRQQAPLKDRKTSDWSLTSKFSLGTKIINGILITHWRCTLRQDAIFHSSATGKCVSTSDDLIIWNSVIKLPVYHPVLYLNFKHNPLPNIWAWCLINMRQQHGLSVEINWRDNSRRHNKTQNCIGICKPQHDKTRNN
jgi:hypothetical protein